MKRPAAGQVIGGCHLAMVIASIAWWGVLEAAVRMLAGLFLAALIVWSVEMMRGRR